MDGAVTTSESSTIPSWPVGHDELREKHSEAIALKLSIPEQLVDDRCPLDLVLVIVQQAFLAEVLEFAEALCGVNRRGSSELAIRVSWSVHGFRRAPGRDSTLAIPAFQERG